MPITATLDPTLAQRVPGQPGRVERFLHWLLPRAPGRPAEIGSFAAMMGADPGDPVLFAEWLAAEENLARRDSEPS